MKPVFFKKMSHQTQYALGIFVCSLIVGLSFSYAEASQSSGTIDPTSAGFKYTRICKDVACSTFGNVNWKPTLNASTNGATAVSVTDSGLSGHIWGDEIGWINLSPAGAGVTIDPNTGTLTGKGYSTVGGWINFSPTGAGVSINSSGEFTGNAYVAGINGGWMKFSCPGTYCVKTDWVPVPNRSSGGPVTPVGGGGGGGGGGAATQGGGTGTTTLSGTSTWFIADVKRADLKRDGIIDIIDFNTLMVHWNRKGQNDIADPNQDGVVDIRDFNLVMVHWGKREIPIGST
jgi:hypothetical protein